MQSPYIHKRSRHDGFTLVEMLVVAPIAILTIAILVSLMVSLVGQTMLSAGRAATTYSIQDSLDRIEQDAKVAGAFASSYDSPISPQGRNGITEGFNISKGDVILSQQATTLNPYSDVRQLVYFKNQPNPCTSATTNRVLSLKVIYFTLDDGNGTKTLWRRTIMPTWNTNGTPDANTVCSAPWQRNNCPTGNALNSNPCQTYDERILDNVSGFTSQYLLANGTITTDPSLAKTILVSVTTQRKVAGDSQSSTMTLRVTRGNDIPLPSLPSVSTVTQASPNDITFNNPDKVTFQWSSTNSDFYTVSVSIGGGAWSTPQTTLGTSWSVTTNPGQSVSIKVVAYNNAGSTALTQFTISAPLFSDIPMTTNWQCYSGTTYYCPSFTKTSAGVVLLRGLAYGGTDNGGSGSIIGYLPAGFAPTYSVVYPVLSNGNSTTQIRVGPDGAITWFNAKNVSGANGWVSLDGIQLLASDAMSATSWYGASNYNSWGPYTGGGGYRTDGLFFGKDTLGRAHSYGLMAGSTTLPAGYATIATLPPGFTPPAHIIVISSDANGKTTYLYYQSGNPITYVQNGTDIRSHSSMYYPSGASVSWTVPTLNSPWGNHGGGFDGAGFTKASDSIVQLRGVQDNTGGTSLATSTLFTLPSGYRPLKSMVMLVPSYPIGAGVYARVDVNPTGNVTLNFSSVGGGGWISLSGINFYPDGS